MAPKSAPSSKAGAEPKRQRRMMMIAEKVKILDMLKEGRMFAAVACQYGVNESTVRYIKKEEATMDDVNELLDCHSQPLTNEDLEELTKLASEEEEEEQQETEEVVSPPGLTLERLAEICRLAKDLQERSQEWDDDVVQSVKFCNMVDDIMTKLLFDRKKKQQQQLPITMFLQPFKNEPVPTTTTEGLKTSKYTLNY